MSENPLLSSKFLDMAEETDLSQLAYVYKDYEVLQEEFTETELQYFMDPVLSTTPFSANPPNFKAIYDEFTRKQFELYCHFHADFLYELSDVLLEITDADAEAIDQLSELGWSRELIENAYRVIRREYESDEPSALYQQFGILDVNRPLVTRLDTLGQMFNQFGNNTYWVDRPEVGERFTTGVFIDGEEYTLVGEITEAIETEFEPAYDFRVLQYDTMLKTDEQTHWMIEYENDDEMLLYPEDESYLHFESEFNRMSHRSNAEETHAQKTSES
jgi:hypothetical protein